MLKTAPDILRIEYTPNNEGFSIYVFGNEVFRQEKPVPGSTMTVTEMANEVAMNYYNSTVKDRALKDLYEYYVNVFYNGIFKDTTKGEFWRASYENVGSMKALLDIAASRGDTTVTFYDYDDKAVTLTLPEAQAILMELGNFIDTAYRDYKTAKRQIKDDIQGIAYEIVSTFIADHPTRTSPDDFTTNPYGP